MKVRSKRGSALLIVLAFIVIIAGLLLAYMARTRQALVSGDTSSSMVETRMLAQIAEQSIIDDLRQEMLAGSTNTAIPATTNITMSVTNQWAMIPSRIVSTNVSADTNFVNLVKQSLSSRPTYTSTTNITYSTSLVGAARQRASSVNTATPARNGRYISPARWNKPRLIDGTGFTANNQLPDWIMITRAGVSTNGASLTNFGSRAPGNQNFVVGRFAYNIYDISGLLDINVAGYDPSDTSAAAAALRKGSMAYADLTAIPGITDPSALVQWRNKASSSDYTNSVATWYMPKGYRETYKSSGQSDNRFFTRQDLLDYQATHGSGAISTNALPSLTTFSADTDQPSYTPDPARPTIVYAATAGGNDGKNRDNSLNPNVLTTLVSDGTPLVNRRFPLSRIGLVVPKPEPSQVDAIARYFGLAWVDSSEGGYWEYKDSNSSGDTTIKTLAEIALTYDPNDPNGLRPNFIELLQAAIGAGSLGGQLQLNNEPPNSIRRFNSSSLRDASITFNILQIAASIIDQYDADSYPTRIACKVGTKTFMACGIENLPYMYAFRQNFYRVPSMFRKADVNPTERTALGSNDPEFHRMAVLFQPMIWNPNAPGNTPGPKPDQFRLRASTDDLDNPVGGSWIKLSSQNSWWVASANDSVEVFPGSDPRDNNTAGLYSFDPDHQYITFQTSPTGKAAFTQPYTLKSPNYPPGANTASPSDNVVATLSSGEGNDSTFSDQSNTQAIGFLIGYCWQLNPVFQKTIGATKYSIFDRVFVTNSGHGVNVQLQYLDQDGNYVTYDTGYNVTTAGNPYLGSNVATNIRSGWVARSDPRSDRFGYVSAANVSVYPDIASRYWQEGRTMRPTASQNSLEPTASLTTGPFWTYVVGSRYWDSISENKADSPVRYKDADNVQRVAMGGYSSGTTGLPMVGDYSSSNADSRPVILNRPFQSVAELGYAFRGVPWKQLDLSSPESADAALLDYFCVYEPDTATADDPVVAGRLNLNTRRSEVVQAMLRGAGTVESDPSFRIDTSTAKAIADALVAWTQNGSSDQGPLRNRSELVGKFRNGTTYSGFSQELQKTSVLATDQAAIQTRREAVMRALADSGTTRTWSFLIDLIVQSGRYPENETNPANFQIKGERRYWIHLSMDRFTGKVIAEQVESVNE